MMHNEGLALVLLSVLVNQQIVIDAVMNVPYGTSPFKVSAFTLNLEGAGISQRFNFSARDTSACAYVARPPFIFGPLFGDKQTILIFTMRDIKTNITLTVWYRGFGSFTLDENGRKINVARLSPGEEFNLLCVLSPQVTGGETHHLSIKDVSLPRYPITNEISSNMAEDTEMEFTVGGPSPHVAGAHSFSITIAGLSITNGMTQSFKNNFNYVFHREDSAKLRNVTFTDFNEWSNERNSTIKYLSFFEMLATMENIIPLDGSTYKDPNIACKQFNGRPIGRDEIFYHDHFLHQLIKNKTHVADEEKNTLIWIEECTIFDAESKTTQIACAPPNYPWTLCFYNDRVLFSFKKAARSYSSSIAPGSLYSHVKEFLYSFSCDDTVARNNSFECLKSRRGGGTITFSDGKWRVNIPSTSDVWFFNEAKLPLGINTWHLEKEAKNQELILSNCHEFEYNCYNGQCIQPTLKCNGDKDCADGSDELHCPSGTRIYRGAFWQENPTLVEGGILEVQISHDTQISKIDEMKFSDRSLKINLDMTLSWTDERFQFRKGVGKTTYNCSYLPWNPKLQIFSSCDNEISVNPTIGKGICSTKFKNAEEMLNFEVLDVRSTNDSIVHQKFQIQFELPCRFDFELFPFASQTCNFCVGIKNDDVNTDYKFIYSNVTTSSNNLSSISNLGDFTLESFTHVVINHTKLNFSIDFSSPFNYYIVAGYLPSVLILLVSYITLFFRLDLFSERIGVSLTALLTMVFLFVETSSNVIKTSYIKYLDIWFLSAMTFSVGLVLFNSLLHYDFWKREEVEDLKKMEAILEKRDSQERSSPEGDSDTELKMDLIKGPDSSQRKLNRGGRIIFPILFFIFCLSYIIGVNRLPSNVSVLPTYI